MSGSLCGVCMFSQQTLSKFSDFIQKPACLGQLETFGLLGVSTEVRARTGSLAVETKSTVPN